MTNYDIDFRFKRALQPQGLRSVMTAMQAIGEAAEDCKRAGADPEQCPAVLLLVRHLSRVALGSYIDSVQDDDLLLRLQCEAAIDRLKEHPAIIILAHRSLAFDEEAKTLFHREAVRYLRLLASTFGYGREDYDIRTNPAGPAVSGETVLHSDDFYVQINPDFMPYGDAILYRRVKNRSDQRGQTNNFCDIKLITQPTKLAEQMRTKMAISRELEPVLL